MPRFSWAGLPTWEWSRRADAVEGLVLSGGGSRASFQIGALGYLYRHAQIAPTVIVGTSAGAILTAMLSQSLDPSDQAKGVERLERLWFQLRRQSDMFTERAWFTTLQARGSEWMSLLTSQERWLSPRRRDRGSTPDPQDHTLDEHDQLSGQAETLRIAMREHTPESSGWSPALVMQLMSSLPRLRGAPSDLGAILRGAEASRSMYYPGPLLERLLDAETFRSNLVGTSGMKVRISTVCLETGELRFMREDGRLVDRDDRLISRQRHDFSRGVLASCSIPAVFAPVDLEGEFHVDGGVRENVPAEMAIGKLGVDRCWVISSSPADDPPKTSFATKSIAQVVMRATEILTDETERDEIAYARSAGARVIEPELPVHDALQVDPGLIRINRDYGWVRAAEVHLEVPETQRKVHRELFAARLAAHRLEAEHFCDHSHDQTPLSGPQTAPTEAILRTLAQTKLELADLIGRARAEALPPGAETWWSRWEEHPRTPTFRPPWLTTTPPESTRR